MESHKKPENFKDKVFISYNAHSGFGGMIKNLLYLYFEARVSKRQAINTYGKQNRVNLRKKTKLCTKRNL